MTPLAYVEKTGRPGEEYNVLLADDKKVFLGRIIKRPDGYQPVAPQARTLPETTCPTRHDATRLLLNYHLRRSSQN